MAAELEKYLSDSLKRLPTDNVDRQLLEKILLATQKYRQSLQPNIQVNEQTLTEEFARRVNEVTGSMSDDVSLKLLVYRGYRDQIPEWGTFYNSLTKVQRRSLTGCISPFVRSSDNYNSTVGALRQLSEADMINSHRHMGKTRASFIRLAFLKPNGE